MSAPFDGETTTATWEEMRVSGDPGPGFPPYLFEARSDRPETWEAVHKLLDASAFRRNVSNIRVQRRRVHEVRTETPWTDDES